MNAWIVNWLFGQKGYRILVTQGEGDEPISKDFAIALARAYFGENPQDLSLIKANEATVATLVSFAREQAKEMHETVLNHVSAAVTNLAKDADGRFLCVKPEECNNHCIIL